MIEFVVEDGTGKTDSTSYASIDDFKQYWLNRGTDHTKTTEDTIKGWLNSATEYIDVTYVFKGSKTDDDQALEWPRTGACDRYEEIESDVIPNEIINGVCYLAAQVSSGSLNTVETGLKSYSYGPVSKTFSNSSTQKSYKYIDKLFKYLLLQGNQLVRVN